MVTIDHNLLSETAILESMNDGVYVTDRERRIVYWNAAAERITGWKSEEVLGQYCYDNLLGHVDRHNRRLCGEDTCPMRRAIVTGQCSETPIVVFARHKAGHRIPTQVSVAPILDEGGEVAGAVEVFRDVYHELEDLGRARRIQLDAMRGEPPADPSALLAIRTHYAPHDMVGGDFYFIEKVDETRWIFLLGDVTGHGVSAALQTMHLRTLWENHHTLWAHPQALIAKLNQRLFNLMGGESSFATAILGLYDSTLQQLEFIGAGHPALLVFRRGGGVELLRSKGLPLAMLEDARYEKMIVQLAAGDTIFGYTDGAVEIWNQNMDLLEEEGLVELLQSLDYPEAEVELAEIEKRLIDWSGAIQLNDDLTLIELKVRQASRTQP